MARKETVSRKRAHVQYVERYAGYSGHYAQNKYDAYNENDAQYEYDAYNKHGAQYEYNEHDPDEHVGDGDRECAGDDYDRSPKLSRPSFHISSFLKRLRGEEGVAALQEFVDLSYELKGKENPAFIFLQEGYQLRDILDILNARTDRDQNLVSLVFKVLYRILLRVVTQLPEYTNNAEEMCLRLFGNHSTTIESELKGERNYQCQKSLLLMLTAIATMNARMALLILNHVSFTDDILNKIVKVHKTKRDASTRTCHIHLVMAFLVNGNSKVTRTLLKEQRRMLLSILPGLEYDSSELVIFVMTTLLEKIVEVMEISKTEKLRTFNTHAMWDLLKLYNWKGPNAFISKWKSSKNDHVQIDLNNLVDKEEADQVARAVHSLLLRLCTSFRYGVVFNDRSMGTGQVKQNGLIATILQGIDKPWEDKLKTELIVKTISVCPEMSFIPYSKVAEVLNPRDTSSWMEAIFFAIEVISSVTLDNLATLNPKKALQAAKAIACPSNLLLTVADGMKNPHPAVRLKTAEFLLAVLKVVATARHSFADNYATELDSYVVKLLPGGGVLGDAMSSSLNWDLESVDPAMKSIPIPSIGVQLMALLDVMLLYQDLFPLLLYSEEKEHELLSTLENVLEVDSYADATFPMVKAKTIQLLSLLDAPSLSVDKHGFFVAVSSLLEISSDDGDHAFFAQSILGSLLVKYRVVESTSSKITDELGIWLHCCKSEEKLHRYAIFSFLRDIFVSLAMKSDTYLEQALELRQRNSATVDTWKLKDEAHVDQVFEELLGIIPEEDSAEEKEKCKSSDESTAEINKFDHPGNNEISIILLCVINTVESIKNLRKPVENYVSKVLVHILHTQSCPRTFFSIMELWTKKPNALEKYINGWMKDKPVPLEDLFGHFSPECSLSRLFLQPEKAVPELKDENPVTILLLTRLVCFHVAQLAEKQLLTEEDTENALHVIITLFRTLIGFKMKDDSSLAKEFIMKFLNIIFKHPILLSYFSPLHRKKNLTGKIMTNLLLNILKKIEMFEILIKNLSDSFLTLMREKFTLNVTHYLTRSKVPSNTGSLITALNLLSLTDDDKCLLVSKLKKFMLVEPWTELLVYILQDVNKLPSHEVKSLGRCLKSHLQQPEAIDNNIWRVCDAFCKYLEKFRSSVLHVPDDLFLMVACEEGKKLASVLIFHKRSNISHLTKLVKQENSSLVLCPDVLYHLMDIATVHGPLPHQLVNAVYSKYAQEFVEAMKEPFIVADYLIKYSSIVELLVSKCMDLKFCKNLCETLGNNFESLELCTPFHLSIMSCMQDIGGWRKTPVSFVNIMLHHLGKMLEHDTGPTTIIQLCTLLLQHMSDKKNKWNDTLKPNWENITVIFLRNGLKKSKTSLPYYLLIVLSNILWKANNDKVAENIFKMTTSHSQFLSIILDRENADIKLAVLQLILVCYHLAPQVMKSSHVPVWLGAYGASLSHCDQMILKILLCIHKNKEIDLNAYRPFLWGEAAISHYSVRSQSGMSLWRIPEASRVLHLLNFEMVEATVANYPFHRKLLTGVEQGSKSRIFCFNNGCFEFLDPCQPEVYDPAFLIPLFNFLLSPESYNVGVKFNSSGGLALTLAAFGCACELMRMAAYSVVARFHSHLYFSSAEKVVVQYIEAIRCSIQDFKDWKIRRVQKLPKMWTPKVPKLSAIFLARISLVFTNPLHVLYRPLIRVVLVQPSFTLQAIPGVSSLLRPNAVDFRSSQIWLLTTVLYGLKECEDSSVIKRSHMINMLLSLLSSSLSSIPIKSLTLQILERILLVKSGISTLMMYGLIPCMHASLTLMYHDIGPILSVPFIRILFVLRDHCVVPVTCALDLLFKLPAVVDAKDLLVVLQFVHFSILSVCKRHLMIVLHLCYLVLDQQVVESCARQLFISCSDLINVNDESNTESEHLTKTVNKTELNNMLKSIVNNWLAINIGNKEKLEQNTPEKLLN